jgi:transposase-like protein
LDRSTLRRIQERTDVSFSAKWRMAQGYASHIPSPLQNYARNGAGATHILLMDATFTKVDGEDRAIMIAYDTGVGVVDYWIDCTENKTAYAYLLQRLDKAGYRPICVVTDGHFSVLPILKERNLPHQRCLFHLLKNLRCSLTKDGDWKTPKDHVLYSRIKGILKTGRIEDLPVRIDEFRRFERIFPGRKEVFRWFWSVLPDAVIHLSYEEDVPRTTALIENLNGQVKQRIKTFRGVKSERSLNNLLKILFHFRKYK